MLASLPGGARSRLTGRNALPGAAGTGQGFQLPSRDIRVDRLFFQSKTTDKLLLYEGGVAVLAGSFGEAVALFCLSPLTLPNLQEGWPG